MLPKLSYLSSGQFTFCDNNAKMKTNSKYLSKSIIESNENETNRQADVDGLVRNLEILKKVNTQQDLVVVEDLSNTKPYYIGLSKDLKYESKHSNNDNKRNSLILDKNFGNNSNISFGNYKKSILFDKQSVSSSSTSSLSSYTTSSISPSSDKISSSDTESLTFVSFVSPCVLRRNSKIKNKTGTETNEKKEEEITDKVKYTTSSQNESMKEFKKFESKTKDSNTLPRTDRPKIFTLNADLIRQKTLLKKNNNFEEQKQFMKKIIERPNLDLNRPHSITSSALSLFEIEDSNSENELSIIQSKLESSHLSILSKDKLLNDSNYVSPTTSTSSLLIVSRHGTVRGAVNHVKTSLKEIFKEPQITNPVTNAQLNIKSNNNFAFSPNSTKSNEKLYLHYYLARDYEVEEHMKIVIYTTSLQVVRLSYDKCKRVKKILQNHCVRYEEKDLYKNKEYQRELKYRLNLKQIDVPHIFFNGKHVGNCDELELFSDQGVLNKLFKDLDKIRLRIYCAKCGGYRFVLCTLCNGSKRKHNNFTNLKCTHCNEDGLIRCDECLDQQE